MNILMRSATPRDRRKPGAGTSPPQCDPLTRVNMYNPTVAAGLGEVGQMMSPQ